MPGERSADIPNNRGQKLFSPGTAFIIVAALATLLILPSSSMAKPKRHPPSPFQGKTIRSLTIIVHDVFEGDNLDGFYRGVNSLKVNTRERVIKRELLFKEGDKWEDFRISESERRLRELRYIRNVSIQAKPDGDVVDVEVHVQDTWTLIPLFAASTGTGKSRTMVGLKESNIVGQGKRFEVSYEESESREILGTVYEDNRFLGSRMRLQGAVLERSDGDEYFLYFGQPAWTLVDRQAWYVNLNTSDTVGRLFQNGTEDYIYRQEHDELDLRYMLLSRGNPEKKLRRFWLGYDWLQDTFDQADAQDYQDLDLDPAEVSNDPSRLPSDRRYTGPFFSYEYIEPDFISMNYIDRFDRIEDYNLGLYHDIRATIAPSSLGSEKDAALFSLNQGRGWRFSPTSFLRGEFGLANRLESDGFVNGLARVEARYYNVLGNVELGDIFLGRHTLASSFSLDYGSDLDRDRQLSLGADNGLRGYKARAFNGDKRFLLNLEDRIHLADDVYRLISVGAATFLDVGGASTADLGELITEDLYEDVGVGLRFAFPRSSGGQVIRLDMAFPLRSAADGSNSFEVRLLFATGQIFSSRLRTETSGPEKANVEIGVDR